MATQPPRRSWPDALMAVGVALYLLQHVRMAPNHVDEGLILSYVRAMAAGAQPFWDIMDVYGPAAWPWPVLAYRLGGEQVLAVRVGLWLVKLACVGAGFWLVRTHAGRLYAWLAAVLMTLLLGVPWQLAQTPYPFYQVLLLELIVWHLLLARPVATLTHRLVAAGVLTGLAILSKVNMGCFLFAGGLFACAYWLPGEGEKSQPGPAVGSPMGLLGLTGLGLFGAAFHLMISAHYDVWYGLYLSLPMGMLLVWTHVSRAQAHLSAGRLRAFVIYASSCLVTVAAVIAVSLGPGAVSAYLSEQGELLSRIQYAHPFVTPGSPGHLGNFNGHHWMQLPWLISVVFGLWAWRHRPAGHGRQAGLGPASMAWGFYATHLFVMYSRADEAHVYQAMLGGVVVLFVLLGSLEPGRGAMAYQGVLVMAVAAAALSLGSLVGPPSADAHSWQAPHLDGLNYRPGRSGAVKPAVTQITERQVDRATDAAAAHVARLCRPDEPVLVFNRDELVTFAADRAPAGGRYAYLFYLVKNGFIGRADYDHMAPPEVLEGLLQSPPCALVDSLLPGELHGPFPELGQLLRSRYVQAGAYQHYVVYQRLPQGELPQLP